MISNSLFSLALFHKMNVLCTERHIYSTSFYTKGTHSKHSHPEQSCTLSPLISMDLEEYNSAYYFTFKRAWLTDAKENALLPWLRKHPCCIKWLIQLHNAYMGSKTGHGYIQFTGKSKLDRQQVNQSHSELKGRSRPWTQICQIKVECTRHWIRTVHTLTASTFPFIIYTVLVCLMPWSDIRWFSRYFQSNMHYRGNTKKA